MIEITAFPVHIDGQPYHIEIGSWKARDVTDFSPKTTVPGTGAVFGDLQMYQPIAMNNWQHGLGFIWHDDEAGYLSTDGNVDTRHQNVVTLFTNGTSSDTNTNIKEGGLVFGGEFFTWGAAGLRRYATAAWSQPNVQRPIIDAVSEGSTTGIADLGTHTHSHTITAEGSSRALIVMVCVDAAAADFTDVATMETAITATFPKNGTATAMTVIAGSAGISTLGIIAFFMVAPDTGAGNIIVSFDTGGGTTEAVVVAQSFIYVDQTTPVGTITESTGSAATVTIADTDSDDQNHNLLMLGILQSESTTALVASSDSSPAAPTIQVQDDITTATDIMLAGMVLQSTTGDPTPSFVMTWTNSVAFAACVLPIQTISEIPIDFLFENGEYLFAAPTAQRLMKSTSGSQDFTPAGINNASNDYSWMEMHGGYIFAGKNAEAQIYFDGNSDLSSLEGDPAATDELTAGPGTVGTIFGVSFLEKLAIPRTDGLWIIDGPEQLVISGAATEIWTSKRTLNFKNLRDSVNFRSVATWGGSLYFTIQDKILYEWNGAKLQNITPGPITDAWEYVNYHRFDNFTPFGDWLLLTARTSESSYTESILAWDGVGFHKLLDPITDGDGSITMVAIDTANNYIWYHVNKPTAGTDTTSFIAYQTDSDFAFATFPTSGTHQLTTSRIHAGFRRVEKSMPALWIEVDNLSATRTIEVQYAIDDSNTYRSWQTLTNNGEHVLYLPQNKTTEEFSFIRLRFILVTDSTSETPVLEAFSMMVMMRPDFTMGYTFDVIGGNSQTSGMFEDDRTGYSIMHDLREARNKKYPIPLITPFGDEVLGYLTSITENAVEYEPDDQEGGAVNILQIIRCNFVETLTISGDLEPYK